MPERLRFVTEAKLVGLMPSVAAAVTRMAVERVTCKPPAVAVDDTLLGPDCCVVGVQRNVLLALVALVNGRAGIMVAFTA